MRIGMVMDGRGLAWCPHNEKLYTNQSYGIRLTSEEHEMKEQQSDVQGENVQHGSNIIIGIDRAVVKKSG